MTVTELLSRIMNAYAGATSDAMKSFTPVFYARLRRHEGPALEEAATEVLGSFKPRFDQKFPIPVDFEAHLRTGKLALPAGGTPIRERMAARRERKASLMAAWNTTQRPLIENARGSYVAQAATFMADRIASDRAWSDTPERIVLTAEQVEECEQRAVSQARVYSLGGRVLNVGTNDQWDFQMERTREDLRAGTYPPRLGETAFEIRQPQRITDRLAELARARREGRPPPPPIDDIPEAAHG